MGCVFQEFVAMEVNDTVVYPWFTRDGKWLGFGTPQAISDVEGSILWREIWGYHPRARLDADGWALRAPPTPREVDDWS
jgi:hypothetical protein